MILNSLFYDMLPQQVVIAHPLGNWIDMLGMKFQRCGMM